MSANQSTISDVFRSKFSDTVFELAQQTQARLRPIVEFEQLDAENLMLPRVGSVEAQTLNERFPEIIPADLLWDNRKLTASRIGVPMYVDRWDTERMLADPKSVLAKRAAQALERNLDRIIIQAATAPVFTGRQGTVQVSAATDGVITVNAQAGFTYDTLLQIDQNFQSVEIGTESPIRKYLLMSEQEHAKLMREGTLISGDFSKQYVVDSGRMKRALDFEIIIFGSAVPNPMLSVSNNVRSCLAIATGAIKVGITKSWEIDVEKVNGRWHTDQVLASGIVGGVRMEAPRVQVIQTTVGQ